MSSGPLDEVAQYNIARWHALAQANALFTRPYLDLDAASARERLDPHGRLGDVVGKRVLCLAGGGGRQSAAFALLGAIFVARNGRRADLLRAWGLLIAGSLAFGLAWLTAAPG